MNPLPGQLEATTHPALYGKKSWREDTTVSRGREVFVKLTQEVKLRRVVPNELGAWC